MIKEQTSEQQRLLRGKVFLKHRFKMFFFSEFVWRCFGEKGSFFSVFDIS